METNIQSFSGPSSQRGEPEQSIQNTENHNPNNKQSYSNITKNIFKYPKKEQGIILNAAEGIKIKEYIYAVGNLVDPKNILAASRLSNERICIYLSSKTLVDELLKNQQSIEIGEHKINMRRLITPSKKIILSNVCPTIPNEIIEQSLQNLNIKCTSPIYLIKAGLPETNYSHIVSFRRFLYIVPEENIIIPDSIIIYYEGDNYRIFIQPDELKCFKCNQEGHLSSRCNNISNTDPQQSAETRANKRHSPSTTTETADTPIEERVNPFTNLNNLLQENLVSNIQENTEKGEDETHTQIRSQKKKKLSQKNKKPKTETDTDETSLDQLLEPIKRLLDSEQTKYSFTYPQFEKFITEIYSAPNPVQTANKFMTDTDLLIATLQDFHCLLTHRKIKYRFTRIISNIKKQLALNKVIKDQTSASESYNLDSDSCY